MVMLFGFVLRSTSGTKDFDIIRLYEASKCSLRLYKATIIKKLLTGFVNSDLGTPQVMAC